MHLYDTFVDSLLLAIFLGEIVSKESMKPDPQKLTAITQMTPPSNRGRGLARFLGMKKYLTSGLPVGAQSEVSEFLIQH